MYEDARQYETNERQKSASLGNKEITLVKLDEYMHTVSRPMSATKNK